MKNKMKRKNQNRVNRVVSAILTLALVLCQVCLLSACGKEDVEKNKATIETLLPDSMDVSDVADMLEDGMSVDEVIDRVEEVKESEVTSTDKPAEVSPTQAPVSTPTPTAKPTPEPTATPEPTPTHVHNYAESITTQATCATAGVKTLTCSCGEAKTESIPATGQHNWEAVYQTVTHPGTGHVEQTETQVQVGTTTRTEYACGVCDARFDTPQEKTEHCKATGDINHAFATTIAYDYSEPVYETRTESVWIVDSPEYTTQELVEYECSVCHATK